MSCVANLASTCVIFDVYNVTECEIHLELPQQNSQYALLLHYCEALAYKYSWTIFEQCIFRTNAISWSGREGNVWVGMTIGFSIEESLGKKHFRVWPVTSVLENWKFNYYFEKEQTSNEHFDLLKSYLVHHGWHNNDTRSSGEKMIFCNGMYELQLHQSSFRLKSYLNSLILRSSVTCRAKMGTEG